MKSRIHRNYDGILGLNEAGFANSEKIMKRTWSEFREALAKGKFEYTDTKSALTTIFLKQFDEMFQDVGKSKMTVEFIECLHNTSIGRGTVIKPDEPLDTPLYDRFIPNAEFIKEDNRFSPQGVEWLYLSIGDSEEVVRGVQKRSVEQRLVIALGFATLN